MPERDFVIVRFVFILVHADSLQYLNLIMPERGIVIVCTIQCSGLQICFTNQLSSRPQLPDRAISPSARTISHDKVRFHSPTANFTHFFRNNPEKVKAPSLRRLGAFLCSLKNEGYNYESLNRLALRRVEQLYSDGCGSVFLSTLILNNANMKTV